MRLGIPNANREVRRPSNPVTGNPKDSAAQQKLSQDKAIKGLLCGKLQVPRGKETQITPKSRHKTRITQKKDQKSKDADEACS